jgi:hypothetical protein
MGTQSSVWPLSSGMILKYAAGIIRDEYMPNQARVVKVLAILLASMTIGAIILMTLGHNPPSAGPFSLWSYYCLDPVKEAISSEAAQFFDRWNCIEIYYSGTKSGNIEHLSSLNGLADSKDINYHFCLYNGLGGIDGQIRPTEKWHRQRSATPGQNWYGSDQTIRICVIADGTIHRPTDCQIKRIQMLVEELCRNFGILPGSVHYPSDWR